MIKSYNVIIKLIDTYHYGGALKLISEIGLDEADVAYLIESCKYAVNFDFQTAFNILNNLSDEIKEEKEVKHLKRNLEELRSGKPQAIFSELLDINILEYKYSKINSYVKEVLQEHNKECKDSKLIRYCT